MRKLSIWRVRVASLTCLATRHKKTCIDACQAREVSPDQPRKTCQNLERTETKQPNNVNKQQSKQSVCHARKEPFIDILEVEVRISGSQNLLAIGFQCPGFQTVLLMVGPFSNSSISLIPDIKYLQDRTFLRNIYNMQL